MTPQDPHVSSALGPEPIAETLEVVLAFGATMLAAGATAEPAHEAMTRLPLRGARRENSWQVSTNHPAKRTRSEQLLDHAGQRASGRWNDEVARRSIR